MTMPAPLDQFDIEASSLITMVAFTGGGPVTQKRIADELREFVRTQTSFLHRGMEEKPYDR